MSDMTVTLSAVAGLFGGLVLGMTMMLMARGSKNPHGDWLGRRCWVRPAGRAKWEEHVVVAVSHKGAICVRRADRMDEDGYWIKKQNVRWRVRWSKPTEVG